MPDRRRHAAHAPGDARRPHAVLRLRPARCSTERVALLRATLPARRSSLHYAMKANPMPALVAHMARLVDGLDVASGGELEVALDAGDGSARNQLRRARQERRRARAGGGGGHPGQRRVAARNRGCWRSCRARAGQPARVAVRVNPDFELKSSGMKMGGGPKQFGVDAEAVPEAAREIGRSGSPSRASTSSAARRTCSAEAICEAQRRRSSWRCGWRRSRRRRCARLNIGGGFGIPYFPGERAARSGPDRREPARDRRRRAGARLPQARARHRARPLPRRRGGHLRLPRRRPQGLARRRFSSSPTAACTITWRRRATSAR